MAPILLLWALCLIDYGRLVLPGPWPRQWVAESDFSRQFFPFQRFVASRLAAGALPIWNPYLYAGHPQLADPQTAVFSPVGLLFNLTAGHDGLSYIALEWRGVVDFALAALFAYLFMRAISRSRLGGLVGALCFTFGGFLSSYPLPQLPILETVVWLPLTLYCVERAFSTGAGGIGWASLAGLAGGILALSGHAQTALLCGYAIAAYAIYRLLLLRPPPARSAARLVLAAAIAGGLASAQLLPTLAFAGESTRAQLSLSQAGGGYAWQDFRQLVLPGGLFERTYYIGVLPLALALAAGFRRPGRFWLGLWLIAAVIAMGNHTPLFRLLYQAAPGFAAFRDQERVAFLCNFAECVLAAQGAAWLVRLAPRRPATARQIAVAALVAAPAAFAGILLWPSGSTPDDSVHAMPVQLNLLTAALLGCTALATVALARRRYLPRSLLATMFVAVSAFNLLAAGANLNRTDHQLGYPADVAASMHWIAAQPGSARAGNASDNVIPPNAGTLYGVSAPLGDSPIEIRRVANLLASSNGYRLWQLFNVRYVVTRQRLGDGLTPVHQSGNLITYAVQYGLPRAWAVRDVRVAESPEQAQALALNIAQPGGAAVVEGHLTLSIHGPDLPRDQRQTWLVDAPGSLQFQAQTTDNALLVVSEPLVRGWQAFLDGHAVPLYHADAALMALELPAGDHAVTLRFEQPGLKVGLLLAAAGLLLAAAGGVISLLRMARRDG